jgi:hypothetical protein
MGRSGKMLCLLHGFRLRNNPAHQREQKQQQDRRAAPPLFQLPRPPEHDMLLNWFTRARKYGLKKKEYPTRKIHAPEIGRVTHKTAERAPQVSFTLWRHDNVMDFGHRSSAPDDELGAACQLGRLTGLGQALPASRRKRMPRRCVASASRQKRIDVCQLIS